MNTKVVAKIVVINADGKILLLRRSMSDARRPGQWDFPGGNVESGETVEFAVIREAKEEAGLLLDAKNIQLFWAASDVVKTDEISAPTNIVWIFYRSQVTNSNPKLSYEHDLFRWVRPEEALMEIVYQRHIDMLSYAIKYKLL